jgi:hypothetical protein
MPSLTERRPAALGVCEMRDLGRMGYAAAFAMQQESPTSC